MDWEELKNKCSMCKACELHKGRKNNVFGEGNKDADLMFIGEGPGAEEDKTGRPFVGRAGQLFTIAIEAMEMKREDIYIANIVKCRPPGNRNPSVTEAKACLNYLRNQVALIKPKIIVCLGGVSAKYIIDNDAKITKIRGQWIVKNDYHLIATFHPAALLRDESKKIPFWNDMKKVVFKLRELQEK